MMRLRICAFVLIVTVLWIPSLGFAQNGPARFLAVQTITVVPGMLAQFEGVATQVAEAFKQTAEEPQDVNAFSVMNGRDNRTFLFVWGFEELSEMDTWRGIPAVLAEAYGVERAAEILVAGDQSIETNTTTINFLQSDMSSSAVSDFPEGPPRVTLIETEVDYSKLEDYMLYLSKLKEAEEAAGVSWTRRQQVRGQLNLFSAARLHSSMSDNAPLAYNLLREHLGPVEANILIARQFDAVLDREIVTLMHRPELSRP